jgi:hypothetical protein
MDEGKRIEPELKAREENVRAPKFDDPDGKVPDPSGDTEITQEDRDNPLVNDSSFNQSGERSDAGQ